MEIDVFDLFPSNFWRLTKYWFIMIVLDGKTDIEHHNDKFLCPRTRYISQVVVASTWERSVNSFHVQTGICQHKGIDLTQRMFCKVMFCVSKGQFLSSKSQDLFPQNYHIRWPHIRDKIDFSSTSFGFLIIILKNQKICNLQNSSKNTSKNFL